MSRATTNVPKLKEHLEGLTLDQQKWVKETAKIGKHTVAARKVYKNQKYPEQQGSENLQKPYLRQALLKELHAQGVTDNKLSQTLKEGLEAEKLHTSPTEPDKMLPDHNARLGYFKQACKLKDLYPDKHATITRQTASVKVNVEMSAEELKEKVSNINSEVESLLDER